MTKGLVALVCVICLITSGCGAETTPINVGFDIDDTLLFSSPAFEGAYRDGVMHWEEVNSKDHLSMPLVEILSLVRTLDPEHVWFITSRVSTPNELLTQRVCELTGVSEDHVIFVASSCKSTAIKRHGITVFYGDSDGDIDACVKAGIRGIRVPRRSDSNYGLRKYHPGMFGEEVLDINPTIGS